MKVLYALAWSYDRVVGHYGLLTLHPSRPGTLLLLLSGTAPRNNKRRRAIVHQIIKGAGQSCDELATDADDCTSYLSLDNITFTGTMILGRDNMGRRYCLGVLFPCCALIAVALIVLAAVIAALFPYLLRGQVDQVRELPCPHCLARLGL